MAQICLVTGDPSGDAHGALLVHALKRLEPALHVAALGGPQLRQAGVEFLDDLTQAAAIGPFDAARHLWRFAKARARLNAYLAAARPDVVIPIDFGDFNLPVTAPLAKQHGCQVIYYISPQLWAWGRFRLRWVRRYVDRMLVLFPFEEQFYRHAGIPVTWVGHPLVEMAGSAVHRQAAEEELGVNPWRMTVGLLPGSRDKEIARHLPLFLAAARRIAWHMPGVQFLLPKAPHVSSQLFEPRILHEGLELRLCENRIYECLQLMDGAIVSSGTATIEAAWCGVPMVVVYRTSWPTYLAARAVVRVPHIAMVNLIAEQPIVPEYIQHRATPRRIARELVGLLRNRERKAAMQRALQDVKEKLGPPGAVERAARVVLEALAQETSARI